MPLYWMSEEIHDNAVTAVTTLRDAAVRKRKTTGRDRLRELDKLNDILECLENPVHPDDAADIVN